MSIKPASLDTWNARDGRKIPISNLDDAHLISIIRMLERKFKARKFKKRTKNSKYYILINEAKRRGLTSELNFGRLLL